MQHGKKINPLLPTSLTTDQVISFRRDKIAAKFRAWLEHGISRAQLHPKADQIKVDDYLLHEFNELVKSYGKRTELVSSSITGVLSGAGAWAGSQSPPLTAAIALAGAIVPIPFASMLRKLWSKTHHYPWVFVLQDFK
jgi:hypothetical protein